MRSSIIVILFGVTCFSFGNGARASTVVFDSAVFYSAPNYPRSICSADFNRDGAPDLAVTCIHGANVLMFLNLGDGSFGTGVSYPVQNGPSGICSADFDLDGWPDLAVSNAWSNSVTVLLNLGDGSFGIATSYTLLHQDMPVPICTGDFNGDGLPDLATGNDGVYMDISVLINAGGGAFQTAVCYSTGQRSYSVCAVDYDLDGDVDIAAPNPDGNSLAIMSNVGGGNFEMAMNHLVGTWPWYVFAADINLDGWPDLTTANAGSGNLSVLTSTGNGVLASASNYTAGERPIALSIGEIDGNYGLDIVVANHNSGNLSVFTNQGDGTFAEATNFVAGANPYSVCIADFNRDGRPDVANVNYYGACMSVLINRTLWQFIPDFRIAGESDPEHVKNHTPVFTWTNLNSYMGPSDSVHIQVGTDSSWESVEQWDSQPFASTDSFVTFEGAVLLDGQTYFLRLRVHNMLAWSEWYQTSFRMNSAPSAPVAVLPVRDQVAGNLPNFAIVNGIDAENDTMSYDFEVYGDREMTQLEWQGLNVTESVGTDTTACQVGTTLSENARHWWRVRSFDQHEYSPWTASDSFWVNAIQEPPQQFSLATPSDTSVLPVFDMLPTFAWNVAIDPDPLDTVRYKLEVSIRSNFSIEMIADSLSNNQFTVVDSLDFGTHYWWRVTAKDKTGLTTTSPVNDFWTWKLGDFNHSHGVDLSDLSILIGYLTQNPRPTISPKLVGDVTGDCRIDLSDLSSMIGYLTTGGMQFRVGCE